jgi:predicted amidophosphoribosyltransferase
MLFCTACGFLGNLPSGRVSDRYEYCPRCGKPRLINSCPRCKSSICYEGQKYCMSCGRELTEKEPDVRRRPDYRNRQMAWK